jgi:hypothetical protein
VSLPLDSPSLPASFRRPDLDAAGFTGWTTWPHLRACEFAAVPCQPGVYAVFRPATAQPAFIHPSPAGRFKGQEPSVSDDRLKEEWVPGAQVVYIGKADFRRRRKSIEALRERLSEYARFGAGGDIGHRGGRLIWQLADSAELLVAWHAITRVERTRCYEKRLLRRFGELHDGRRPFANLTG